MYEVTLLNLFLVNLEWIPTVPLVLLGLRWDEDNYLKAPCGNKQLNLSEFD